MYILTGFSYSFAYAYSRRIAEKNQCCKGQQQGKTKTDNKRLVIFN